MLQPTQRTEIVFTRIADGYVRIDGERSGKRYKGQGKAYSSQALIAALTARPSTSNAGAKAILEAAGFVFAHSNGPPYVFYRKYVDGGVYSLCLDPAAVEIEFGITSGIHVRDMAVILRLERNPQTSVWPDGLSNEVDHITVAMAVVQHHQENKLI